MMAASVIRVTLYKTGTFWNTIQSLIVITGLFTAVPTHGEDPFDVCMAERFNVQCPPAEVLVMQSALYGRMETGRCLTEGSDNIGCSNDVLGLLDKWCSGKNMCDFMPIAEFAQVNSKWCGDMISFLRAEYSCLKVATKPFGYCASNDKVMLTSEEGYIASHETDKTGCGSAKKPWIIQAKDGQTITLTLVDFGALVRSEEATEDECPMVYGYILERSLAMNKTLCASSTSRRSIVYESRGNIVEIHIIPTSNRVSPDRFLLHYKREGCSDLTPPDGTWYKRDGNEATIGCDNGARHWDLVCENSAWLGVVGSNCTMVKGVKTAAATTEDGADFPLTSALMLGGIIAGTLCMSLIITGIGIVYMKRYRKKRQRRSSRRTSSSSMSKTTSSGQKTMSTIVNSKYRPVSYHGSTCSHGNPRREHAPNRKSYPSTRNSYPRPRSEVSNRDSTGHYYSHIWEVPPPKDGKKTTSTSPDNEYLSPQSEQLRRPEVEQPQELPDEGAVDDNMSSYYSPNTGHKYYVLDRTVTQQQQEPQHKYENS